MALMVRTRKLITRKLTIEEDCMVRISKDLHYNTKYRELVSSRLKELGYVRELVDLNLCHKEHAGLFAVVETRPPTMEEECAYKVYNALLSVHHEFMRYCNNRSCDKCPFKSDCPKNHKVMVLAAHIIYNLEFFDPENEDV